MCQASLSFLARLLGYLFRELNVFKIFAYACCHGTGIHLATLTRESVFKQTHAGKSRAGDKHTSHLNVGMSLLVDLIETE